MSDDQDGNGQGVAATLTRDRTRWHQPQATGSIGLRAASILFGLFVIMRSLAGLAHAQAVEVQNTQVSRGLPSDTGNGSSSPAALSSADGRYVLLSSQGASFVPGTVDLNNATDVFLHDRTNQQTVLVSRSATSATTTANGRSLPTAISADGEWVLFESIGSNLVPGVTDSNATVDVFLYQRSTGAVSLVSRATWSATTTANGFSKPTAISADGEWVLFESHANDLVSGVTDSNFNRDVFLYQRSTGAVRLVSRSAASAAMPANSDSFSTAISADGEWVLFNSYADDLASGVTDSNGFPDVFLYQRSTGVVSLVSRSAASATRTANSVSSPTAISADGEWVLFQSFATNLVSGVTDSSGFLDVFLYQRSTGVVSLVSRSARSAAATANNQSIATAVSNDGAWVLFQSRATNLVTGGTDGNNTDDVFLYQRSTGVVSLVSRAAATATTTANFSSTPAAISADGEWVLFRSRASDLVSGVTDTDGFEDVFLYQRSTGAVRLVSRSASSATTANADSIPTAISADGEWVLFYSSATDLVPGITDSNRVEDVFLYQRSAGAVSLVSRAAAPVTTTANDESISTAISATGEWVLFSSSATDHAAGVTDTNGFEDAFLYQRSTGAVSLVSRSAASAMTTANNYSISTAISADGEWVLFQSNARNLVSGITDSNGLEDAFLYQRSTGAMSLVSRSAASATMAANADSFPTAISADGEWVLFQSSATNLVSGVTDSNGTFADVFLYQRSTGATSLVSRSVASATMTANNQSLPTAISPDGEWVLYQSSATNIVSGVTDSNVAVDAFLYQRSTGVVSLVSRSGASATTTANAQSFPVATSANGEWVVFRSRADDLVPGVTDSNGPANDVFLYQRSTSAVSLVSRSSSSATVTADSESEPIAISADGEWVLFQSAASNLVSGVTDSNGLGADVFLYQRSTGAVSLISRSATSAATTANNRSIPTAISADGEWVLFQSRATDLVSGVTDRNGVGEDAFLYQRSTGAISLISRSAESPTTTANSSSTPTTISGDGKWVLFSSRASDVVPGVMDVNGDGDTFLGRIVDPDHVFVDGFESAAPKMNALDRGR